MRCVRLRMALWIVATVWFNCATAASPFQLPTRGLWMQFERRGWDSGYYSGDLIQNLTQFDSVVGSTDLQEAELQLDAIKDLGVNTISFELRSADGSFDGTFPACGVNYFLGLHWPQPTDPELANLKSFFDTAAARGIRIFLVLVNTHMEEQPPTNSQTWLGAILPVVKDHPALDAVILNGDAHHVDSDGDGVDDACGGQAEAPLWLGPTSYAAVYVKWAITFAKSLGFSSKQLSPGTIIGDYFTDSQAPAGPAATGGHLWSPIVTLKAIYHGLGIPSNQRLYALSFYEHRKCATAQSLPCTDETEATWANETINNVFNVIGTGTGARVVAYEMGLSTPVDAATWSTSQATANLLMLLGLYGTDGGTFFRWTQERGYQDSDPTLPEAVKRRGFAFTYNPVKDVIYYYFADGVFASQFE